jgi:mono/diheme cytochrome c family protein
LYAALSLLSLAACVAPEAVGQTAPAPPRDPALDMPGYVYAAQHCAACHAIRGGERLSPNPDATPFEVVANTPGMTGYALTVWLNTSHPTMPNFIVESDRIEEVWLYMTTLRREQR